MLPSSILSLSEKIKLLPGIGTKSSQKMSIDLLQISDLDFKELILTLQNTRSKIRFCKNCGFFAEKNLCEICSSESRNPRQICIVEKVTDVISLEKSEIYKGTYHVLNRLISPLDNVFAQDTTINELVERISSLKKKNSPIELILFLKSSFSSDATVAYIKEVLKHKKLSVSITKMAQGLPLCYNPDTLDSATIVRALEDRRKA
jgi:recombination protein RecR